MITVQEREYLLDSMVDLLDEYDYAYDRWALNQIIDEWADQKSTLIEAFKKHPNYIDGKFMIAFDCDYEREFNAESVINFIKYLKQVAEIPTYVANLPEEITQQRIKDGAALLPQEIWHFICYLPEHIKSKTLSENTAKILDKILPQIHPHVGEKASRAINRLCTYLGYDRHPDYNREYAKFADGLSPLMIKRHTILSINPLDYLTMSFGNSWASCHTIDKENKRRMPNSYEGQYSSGTMSYMLDGTSMVFYTVDSKYDGDDYWYQPKINRQMFHWGEEKLIQGRLYPQDNDDNDEAYAPYRQIVQAIMSTIFDFPNLWTKTRGTEAASRYIYSKGTHYRDYQHYSNCTLSVVKNSENEAEITVGARPICIYCGNRHDVEENIDCCHSEYRECECCGRRIHCEDDEYWVGDYCYCSDCVTYCEDCDKYVLKSEVTWVGSVGSYVCDNCLSDNYYRCEYCGEYYYEDDITWVESVDKYVCSSCLDEKFTQCDSCCEYIRNEYIIETDNGYYCVDCCPEEEEEEE